MEQENNNLSLTLGSDRLLLPISGNKSLLWQQWDEKRHCNADWELHLIVDGSCRIDVDDCHCQLQGGQAILIAPGQYHRPKALPGSFKRFTLSFAVQSHGLKQAMMERVPSALVVEADPALCSLAVDISTEWASGRAFSLACVQAMLTLYIVRFFRLLGLEERKVPVKKTDSTRDMAAMIDAYFEAHFAATAGENELASKLHLSRRQLVRVLQDTYGMNFRQKLIHTRMDYAAWLLRTTDTQISQISGIVGYNSEAAFFQVFRKHFGMTPRQYRSQNSSTQG